MIRRPAIRITVVFPLFNSISVNAYVRSSGQTCCQEGARGSLLFTIIIVAVTTWHLAAALLVSTTGLTWLVKYNVAYIKWRVYNNVVILWYDEIWCHHTLWYDVILLCDMMSSYSVIWWGFLIDTLNIALTRILYQLYFIHHS